MPPVLILRADRNRHEPLPPQSVTLLELLVVFSHQAPVGEPTWPIKRVTPCLRAHYPLTFGLFADLGLPIACACLRAFPRQARVARARKAMDREAPSQASLYRHACQNSRTPGVAARLNPAHPATVACEAHRLDGTCFYPTPFQTSRLGT